MALDRLVPYAGTHAVQNVVFTTAWHDEALMADASARAEVNGIARQVFASLGFQVTAPLLLQPLRLGPAGLVGQPDGALDAGFTAVRSGQDLLPLTVQFSAVDGVVIQCDRYTRWAPVFAEVSHIVQVALPAVCRRVGVNRVALQYLDSFTWQAPLSELDLSEVFRKDSRWLAPHVFESTSYWHSHHGYFEQVTSQPPFRQLNNVNASLTDQSGRDTLLLLLVHQADFPSGSAKWVRQADDADALLDVVKRFHSDNKRILSELLSDELARRIALWPKSA